MEETSFERQSIEDILRSEEEQAPKKGAFDFDKYQPVLYQMTKDPSGGAREKENHHEMQE